MWGVPLRRFRGDCVYGPANRSRPRRGFYRSVAASSAGWPPQSRVFVNAKLKDATSTLRNRLVSRALRLADQVAGIPTLAAIRSALIVMLPFMFLGSLAILLNSFPLTAYRDFMAHVFGPRWTLFGETLYSGTFAIMSLSLVFSIGQHLVDQFNSASQVFQG